MPEYPGKIFANRAIHFASWEWHLDDCRKEIHAWGVSLSSRSLLWSSHRSIDPRVESRAISSSTETVKQKKKERKEETKRMRRKRQDKERGRGRGRGTANADAEWREERRKPRKRDGGKERRLPWRLIVSENPSSRSFCFRFYFLPSNPPVHCLPFVHTVPRASPIPASRDFYLVTFQAFLSPIWLFSRCIFFSL